ncbi:MAG TPA: LuxR C-terminal-related transcriptional regulator [Gaiellaceae bacterium]|nr:LuxR C-terminal-related transcriptional regulator [Gaiellaceae bacterium]
MLWGACDALFTPRPLGPLVDVAAETGGEFAELVEAGALPHEVASALLRELSRRAGTVLVIEDVHWADEATLDVVRLLGRRADGVPALVVASYRDTELGRSHPLRQVLGELASDGAAVRLQLEPLSLDSVAQLAEPFGSDASELYAKSGGNPFFVTEALAGGGKAEIPPTVRDAVLARVTRLSRDARTLLEAVAVVPQRAELRLLELLAGDELGSLEECLSAGMLTGDSAGVAFRHELARLAVEESVAPDRRLSLNRAALAALASRHPLDLARLAHHAEAAGEAEAVLEFAPGAAERAASLGAHRESAAQYERAVRFAGSAPPGRRAELLGRMAYEYFLTGALDDAVEAQTLALEIYRELGERLEEGDALRSLSRLLRFVGRTEEAALTGREAVAVLEQLQPGHELALAYANISHLFVTADDGDEAIGWGKRALELAEALGEPESCTYAQLNIAAAEYLSGATEEPRELERIAETARTSGFEELAGRTFLNLVWWPLRHRNYPVVEKHLEPGIEYCDGRGLDLWRLYLLVCRSRVDLDRGRWQEAGDSLALILSDRRLWPVPRVYALAALGLVRARRGDPDVWGPLDEGWRVAEPTGELQRIGPISAARAEAAWLEGRDEAVRAETKATLDLAVRRRSAWLAGELACWRRRAGIRERVALDLAEPFALELAGKFERAAGVWTQLGCPYESALALAQSADPEALQAALAELQLLGARPAATIVSRRLRERGVRGLPRGPRASTRENAAGLTPRELEVLALVAEGLRNGEIATRLFLSHHTVERHVSTILRKLGVKSRGQAAAEAARLGLLQ